ncbi:MAG: 16S rRNA (cytosine(1402)-N(4))-methyltransferase RsmH [Candidatus Kaiserbacteria bacterium]|nr:MAG: 16S rRNA (cytosine(1402)-N(4))-methyltransferase RsmH [Candidatus Kaiserbacteria bacterium]
MSSRHQPVLLHESLEQLALHDGDIVVDATLGGSGAARVIVDSIGSGTLIGFDLDDAAIGRAREALRDTKAKIVLLEANFRNIKTELQALGTTRITKALFDLGWSSYQLDSGRGFSFLKDEPLAMTYSTRRGALTASTIVNEWKEESLADIFFGWGEERYARRIAKAIVTARHKAPIRSSLELAEIVKSAVPSHYRHGRIHPATRTFQALRIAVNDELGALEEGLRGAWQLLAEGGRIAVITFHSLEDRIVKQLFLGLEKSGEGTRLTRKPIVPSESEVRANPRARSAKLRVIEKRHNNEKEDSKDQQIRALDLSGED